jgi:hypothetical protein
MADMDFPASPVLGQQFTNTLGTTYEWNGYAWVIGFYDTAGTGFVVIGDLLDQIRVLLQDTDNSSTAGYRYSTNSIITNLNQGLLEMFRIRPDIFLEKNYVVPSLQSSQLDAVFPIEQQWIPPLVYYAVGMTQVRDDEGTQDTRASAFLTKFTSILVPPP